MQPPYDAALREAVRLRMSPPNCENVAEIARETRIELARGSNHPIGRSVGGYRLFGEEVFAELTQIRILMAMQIPLQDVRRILETRRSGVCTCTSLQDMIRIMAGEIEKRIAALHDLQSERAALFSRWQVCASRKSSTA